MKVYVGFDGREKDAFDVAVSSAQGFGCHVIPLYEDRLRLAGLLTRPLDRRWQMWDLNSSAPQATDFAIARFFVPMLCHTGWCLFVDADVVFLRDPHDLMTMKDPDKAVMVVKHPPLTGTGKKMDNQQQTVYSRKNWSSVVLWNCDHPANRRLNLTTLNQWPGRDLHAFGWLADSEIGELPPEYNWLVNVTPEPKEPAIAHFTLGGPWLSGWAGASYDEIWIRAAG